MRVPAVVPTLANPAIASTPIPQVTTVYVQQNTPTQSQAVPALINLFFPSFGYLLQGRLGSFFVYWFAIALFLVIGLATAGIGLIVLPLIWILSIVDAAGYKPKR
ncbi:hypothetical protein SH661x_002289 [Planctomicrobium sp. SH661]|uniref:hypothetical protein n=1 Tax=Planctomicrobium sp. SH661 TaxID=3448124 RepID=UPI003F5BB0F5